MLKKIRMLCLLCNQEYTAEHPVSATGKPMREAAAAHRLVCPARKKENNDQRVNK